MSDSAIERALHERLLWLREELPKHDRAVVIGLVFSLVPVPPVALMGLLLGLLNFALWKRGHIARQDLRLIQISIGCGFIMAAVTFFLAVLLFRTVLQSLPPVLEFVHAFLSHLVPGWPGSQGARPPLTHVAW